MTDAFAFVAELASQNIKLWLDGDALRINAPAGTLSPVLVAHLKERKPEVMAFLRQHQEVTRVTAIVPGSRPEQLPLSFAQQRLWFLAQLEGASGTYNIPVALRMHGPLDVAAFAASWRQIEARHEALRTSFPQVAGQAYQQINPPGFTLHQVDLAALPEAAQAEEVVRLARREASHIFDLACGPLWRVTLVRLREQEHVLFVTMHHIISDGWSISLLTRELSTLYAQQLQPKADALPALPIQYADYALWQREWLQGAVLQEQLSYWKRQLAGAPPFLPVPTDHPRPAVQRHQGDQLAVTLAQPLASALGRLAQANAATLFMVLQAAFATLLSRYTAQEDVCIGTPIANRQIAEIEPLVGFFVNTLVLRNDLSGNPTFSELLARVRQLTLDAYQHQAVPFELVVENLQPERNLAYSPLFQVMFVLQNNRQETLSLGELAFSPFDVDHPVAKFDLTLTIWEGGTELTAIWSYNSDLFERSTVERMAGHYATLLAGIVAGPDQHVARLPLLSAAEQHQLLVTWNDTAADYPAELCLHQLFEAQVERTPSALAVLYGEQRLTYRELNERANRLAHALIARGVGPEVLVGISMERSLELMVGLLGILKAGGAYLPLDPNYPAERLASMREDAQVGLTVTQAALRERLALGEGQTMIELEHLEPGLNAANPAVAVAPANLAYVIYTSGSTGQPKGVEITHQGVVNYLSWCVQTYPVAAGSGIPINASFSFDGTVPSLFAPLLVGKQVTLLPEEHQFDLLSAALCGADEPFSLIKGTPTHLNLLHQLLPASGGALRTHALVLGGEPLPSSLVATWWEHAPGSRVFNQYGPTEATVACCWFEARPHRALPEMVPIGRPIANTQIYLLDRYRQPVPIGVPGELYIGGVQVARGYLHRPQQTAERFIPNPFGPGRLYKTGDLGRYLPNGNIEFLGRTDDQVKLHGFRIEPGEIEAQLRQCAGVQAAAVVLREAAGGKRLVAYVVGVAGVVDKARAHLGQKLPAYMLPSQFVQVPAIPLLPSGKLDRRALPDPDDAVDTTRLVSPRTSAEALLASIWQEILGLAQVGVTDNFFQVGGHSLAALRLMAQIQQRFGMNLPLATLFQCPTIERLALRLRAPSGARRADWSALVPIQPAGEQLPLFCVPGAGGNALYLYDLARCMGAQRPLYGLQAVGLDGETPPYTTVEAIAAHNIAAIQRVQPHGPYMLGGHSFGGTVAFEMAQQLRRAGHDVAGLFLLDTTAPNPLPAQAAPQWDEARWLIALAEAFGEMAGRQSALVYDELRGCKPEEQLVRFKAELERLQLLPAGADLNQARGWITVFKANILTTYRPGPVIPLPITLFCAEEPLARTADVDRQAPQQHDPALSWGPFAEGEVEVIVVPGNHLTMMGRPHVEVLALRLRECLQRIEKRSPHAITD